MGLIGTTSWLVIRGTAKHSVDASLLSEILPGYSVDLPGSLIGAAELFVVLYLVCRVFVSVLQPRRRYSTAARVNVKPP